MRLKISLNSLNLQRGAVEFYLFVLTYANKCSTSIPGQLLFSSNELLHFTEVLDKQDNQNSQAV